MIYKNITWILFIKNYKQLNFGIFQKFLIYYILASYFHYPVSKTFKLLFDITINFNFSSLSSFYLSLSIKKLTVLKTHCRHDDENIFNLHGGILCNFYHVRARAAQKKGNGNGGT